MPQNKVRPFYAGYSDIDFSAVPVPKGYIRQYWTFWICYVFLYNT